VALFLQMAFGKHSTSVSHDVFNAGTKSGPGKKLVHTDTDFIGLISVRHHHARTQIEKI